MSDRRTSRKQAFVKAGSWLAGGAIVCAICLYLGTFGLGLGVLVISLGLGLRKMRQPGGVPILVYHSVSPDASWLPWSDNTSIRPETLRQHLSALKRGGYEFISTQKLIEARESGTALPPRSVVLQFDDAYLDNFLFAAPILREFNAPAMIFASIDFIEPGDAIRAEARSGPASGWQGYMTAAELRELDQDPLFEIEAHGVSHGRIPVSDQTQDICTEENWKRHAPLIWATTPGNKARWFQANAPVAPLGLGQAIPRNDSALAGRWWRDGHVETDAEFASRVQADLTLAHQELGRILGRAPRIMAWPFDRSDALSVEAAHLAGFHAVTGGRGENRADEPATVLSRVHVQDNAFGGGPLWLEGLAVRARANTAAGAYLWHIVTALATRLRRRRFRAAGYGVAS